MPAERDIVFLFGHLYIYVLSTLGLGLSISGIFKIQQQTMMIAIFTVIMPMAFLSGTALPIEKPPKII